MVTLIVFWAKRQIFVKCAYCMEVRSGLYASTNYTFLWYNCFGKLRLFLVFAFSQVQWKRFLTYFKTIGIKYCILVVALYLASEGLSLMGNIWLSVWTEDPSLKFSNNTTQGHQELRHRQMYYLGGYLGFGIGQGTSFLLEIGSFLKQSDPSVTIWLSFYKEKMYSGIFF